MHLRCEERRHRRLLGVQRDRPVDRAAGVGRHRHDHAHAHPEHAAVQRQGDRRRGHSAGHRNRQRPVKKSVDGGASFADLGSPVDVVAGTASVADHQILQAAGTAVQFKAVFTATGNFTGSTSDATSLTVTKENATILYASANVAALQVGSPGGSLAANSLTLSLQVKETSPDLAAATAGLGSIANAGLSVALAPVAGGSSYASPAPPAPSAGPATPQCARSRARTRCHSP